MLGQKLHDLIAAGELALYLVLDGQPSLLAVEIENLVDRVEKFFGFAGGDFDFVVVGGFVVCALA